MIGFEDGECLCFFLLLTEPLCHCRNTGVGGGYQMSEYYASIPLLGWLLILWLLFLLDLSLLLDNWY